MGETGRSLALRSMRQYGHTKIPCWVSGVNEGKPEFFTSEGMYTKCSGMACKTVRLWDPATGALKAILSTDSLVMMVESLQGQLLLAPLLCDPLNL